jgi:hypothetical protein
LLDITAPSWPLKNPGFRGLPHRLIFHELKAAL